MSTLRFDKTYSRVSQTDFVLTCGSDSSDSGRCDVFEHGWEVSPAVLSWASMLKSTVGRLS